MGVGAPAKAAYVGGALYEGGGNVLYIGEGAGELYVGAGALYVGTTG